MKTLPSMEEYGGGLLAHFRESTLETGSTLSTQIYNCLFHRNNAGKTGAGAYLHYFHISLNPGVEVIIEFSKTHFKENVCNTSQGRGGGMYVTLTRLYILSNRSPRG